jgi:flagellar hook-length control protein FliK
MPTTIMPKLTLSDPSAAAAASATGKSSRGRVAATSVADLLPAAPASAFPEQLKRARTKPGDADSNRAAESKPAAPAKRSGKGETAKKAKASKPAARDAVAEDDAARVETEGEEGNKTNPSDEVAETTDAGEATDLVEDPEAADEKPQEGDGETAPAGEIAAAAIDVAANAAAAAQVQPADGQQAEAEHPDREASGKQGDELSVAGVTATPSEPAVTALSPDGEEPKEEVEAELAEFPEPVTAKAAAQKKVGPARDAAEARPEVKAPHASPVAAKATPPTDAAADAINAASAAAGQLAGSTEPAAPETATGPADDVRSMVDALGRTLAAAGDQAASPGAASPASAANAPAQPELPPEARFAETNHANVVSSMRSQLMPNGGTMRIRLDPPQLGALQVTVHMRDGVMTTSFETSTDEATKLLSHSLAQLKGVLESQGVNVEKLQVQQGPRETQSSGRNDNQQQEQPGGQQQREATRQEQQEHQRREMMRRVWRRLSGAADPLDVTG